VTLFMRINIRIEIRKLFKIVFGIKYLKYCYKAIIKKDSEDKVLM
jgi:hypothetical protein